MQKKAILAYIPVLHEGYKRLFEKHSDAKALCILGSDVIADYRPLTKDIRALLPELIARSIEAWKIFDEVKVFNKKDLAKLQDKGVGLVMPDDEVCKDIAEKYFPGKKIEYDTIFLRWDKHKAMEEKPVQADQKISREKFDKSIIAELSAEALKSSDWWRRIASAIVKDKKVILVAHNEHLPSEHSPYADGDPRDNFHKGIGIEYSTGFHSEARLVAEAAKRGISLEGASLYVTVFPCPPCAKVVAFSGVKKLYYAGGYSVLDQEKILKSKGVEIIYVDLKK